MDFGLGGYVRLDGCLQSERWSVVTWGASFAEFVFWLCCDPWCVSVDPFSVCLAFCLLCSPCGVIEITVTSIAVVPFPTRSWFARHQVTPWGEDAAPCQVAEVAGREAGPRHAPLWLVHAAP